MAYKVKVSVKKNSSGAYTSTARVYDNSGNLISEHESEGSNASQATSNALTNTEDVYASEHNSTAISNASIEYDDNMWSSSQPDQQYASSTPSREYDMDPMYVTAQAPTQTQDTQNINQTSNQISQTVMIEAGEGGPDQETVSQSGYGTTTIEEAQPESPPVSNQSVSAQPAESTQSRGSISTPQSDPPSPKFIKAMTSCVHFDDEGYREGQRGQFGGILSEPIPDRFNRDGDCIITAETLKMGHNNNTMIVLGQDRTGIGEWKTTAGTETQMSQNVASGYSECMGAGAIDIVVGRMAPFAMGNLSGELGPLFNTHGSRERPHPLVANRDLEDENGNTYDHPGFIMDAARIYISQMTDADHNFHITRDVSATSDLRTRQPGSAIVLKADRLRLHARCDVKIVTQGDNERYTSTGLNNNVVGGIHLIAGNGSLKDEDQEPIPKGHRLVSAFATLAKEHTAYVNMVTAFIEAQMELNRHLATHFHQSPAMGASTTPSIIAWAQGAASGVRQWGSYMASVKNHVDNIGAFKSRYLVYGKKNSYINSRYNTTN